jgi:acyl carrier protein
MQAFYDGLAEILELEPAEIIADLDLLAHNWDSLAVVSTIALCDECCDVMLDGQALNNCKTVADIEKLIATKRTA